MEIDKLFKKAPKLKTPESLTATLRKKIAANPAVKPKKFGTRFMWPALATAAVFIIAIRLTPFAPPENIEADTKNINEFIHETLAPVFSLEDEADVSINDGADLFLSEQLDILISNEGGNDA